MIKIRNILIIFCILFASLFILSCTRIFKTEFKNVESFENETDNYSVNIIINHIDWIQYWDWNGEDVLRSIQQTEDGGFIAAGYSNSDDISGTERKGWSDCYILKLLQGGTIEWQVLYGGSQNDYAYSIQQTTDGGYIVAGYSYSDDIPGVENNGGEDCYVLKLSADGTVEWQNMYGGNQVDIAYSIQQTTEGGYIIAGYTTSTDIPGITLTGYSVLYVIKLSNTGSIEWQKSYGGHTQDYARSILQTADGGYVVAASSSSDNIPGVQNNGIEDFHILKLSENGTVEWQKMYGGELVDYAYSIQQTNDNGFIIAGYSNSSNIPGVIHSGGRDYYIVKISADGSLQWQTMQISNLDEGMDSSISICQTLNGDYIVAGGPDCHTLRLTDTGEVQSELQSYQGILNWEAQIKSVHQTADGGLIMAGINPTYNSDYFDCFIIKVHTY
jgi:hypothetical protein